MKALLTPYTNEQSWCEELFPTKGLCTLPLAGKPLAEHWLDLCSQAGVSQALLLDYSFSIEFNDVLMQGKRWPLEISYEGARVSSCFVAMMKTKKAFFDDGEDILILRGAILPECETADELLANLTEIPVSDMDADGVYLRRGEKFFRSAVQSRTMNGVKEYFNLNFGLLEHSGCYVLPGYSAENGVYMGMDVAIMQGAVIKPPVVLEDNISLGRGCSLTNGVIIGRNSMIGAGTELNHTIVLDHTFAGTAMSFDNKIVVAERIIDPDTGVYMDQDDAGIAMDVWRFAKWDWYLGIEYLMALALALIWTVPYLLCLPFKLMFPRNIWWYKLSLDRYTKYWQVLLGKRRLVRYATTDEKYVFRASDGFSVTHSLAQQELDDIFYRKYRNLRMLCSIVIKGIVYRSMEDEMSRQDA